jgi:hypothetical protein
MFLGQESTAPTFCRRRNHNQQFAEAVLALAFANAEHLGAALRANALGGWFTILHGNGLGVFHFSLGATLHAIRFHWYSPLNWIIFIRVSHSLADVKSKLGQNRYFPAYFSTFCALTGLN